MAYSVTNSKGQTYFLNGKHVTLKGGLSRRIFYFSKKEGEFVLDKLPEGYHVVENQKTGLPFLKKSQ